MTFTSPTEDIIVQEGTFAFDYTCSGSVSAGQGVYALGTVAVCAPTTELSATGGMQPYCVGVAAYDQTHGNPVAVYGPGNIVRVIVSGTANTVGKPMVLGEEGKFKYIATTKPSGVYALPLETQATANGTCKAMLLSA